MLNILTFNWHEAYVCMLAKTGHLFDIVERFKGGSSEWFYQTRPVPKNGRLIDEKSAAIRLKKGLYDLVICHNFNDLTIVSKYDIPKVLVFHNMLTTELALDGNKNTKGDYLKAVHEAIDNIKNLHIVFISERKRTDWELEGTVITPGIDCNEYYGYRGEKPSVLRIGNFMKRRDIMMGYYTQEEILRDIPNTMLGINDAAPNARFTDSWDDLKEELRSHRVYLNTTVEGYEDGYNLASLEAMATGMPVVSAYNDSSPIIDGFNGYISKDLSYLSDKIRYLIDNREKAVELGRNAIDTIKERFNIKDFIDRWQGLIDKAVNKEPLAKIVITDTDGSIRGQASAGTQNTGTDQKNILLAYVSYPVTTARYLEESLRRCHNVTTCGPSITKDIVERWKLENMKDKVTPHDISCEADIDIRDIVAKLPAKRYPDLFLWIESVYGYFPKGIKELPFPTACYMIDSHISLNWHTSWASQFDVVFIAQKEYISHFEKAGCKKVIWLPLACDPSYHKRFDLNKEYDISFVGSVTKAHDRRKRLLDILAKNFNLHIERCFLEDMSIAFSKGKIVFNEAVKNDLNMRVFEALASGSMLLTDDPKGSGLTEIFQDRIHLVIYNEENIVELARYYLGHDEEREKIADAGMREVLKQHTYDNRADFIIDKIFNIEKYYKEDKWK